MKMNFNHKVISILSGLLCLSILTSGCTKPESSDLDEQLALKNTQLLNLEASFGQLKLENESLIKEVDDLKQQTQVSTDTPFNQVLNVIHILADQNMLALSEYIHPTKGVRFSPYGYVDIANHLVFMPDQVSTLMTDTQAYTWGNYDGSGDPIIQTFSEYYEEFVYDEAYIEPHIIGNNVVVGTGNSLINISEVYPEGVFVEFHFKGFDPQYEGIDWSSLRLVFEEVDSVWYLVGIIHDQWTI